ncbi:uncharacterized protein [Ptychodera flava]|uniref:uncharacterized protein n=1 Tax=Ptychodera flava TaxID=63121 RepID=UPI00396A1535
MKVALFAFFLVLCKVGVDAKRQCTQDDLEGCERMLTEYTRNPDNWSEEHKPILYCEFVQRRVDCLENLDCDHTTDIEEMDLTVIEWLGMIEPGITTMRALGLCDATESTIEVDYDDPCDEFYIQKNCSEYLSDYLKSRYALTCSAMLKASPCFITGRAKCGIPQNQPEGFVSPYEALAENGHCVLFYDSSDPVFQRQEDYRTEHGLGYFAYF